MSTDSEGIFLKFYFLGHDSVGKKSLVSKINNLKCTNVTNNDKKKKEVSIVKGFNYKKLKVFFQAYAVEKAEEVKEEKRQENKETENYDIEDDLNFNKMKKSIGNYFKVQPKLKTSSTQIENIFFFIFDLTNFSSFDDMILYHKKLNKAFDIKDSPQFILGNKYDLKQHLTNEEADSLKEFIDEYPNLKYYGVSTKLSFDFPKFISEIISEIISANNEDIYLAINPRSNFSVAERKGFGVGNENPGPGEYNLNLYGFNDKKEMKEVMSDKYRYSKKIFMNKNGPIYRKYNIENRKRYGIAYVNPVAFENKKSYLSERGEFIIGNTKGYSMGIKEGQLNLREIRSGKMRRINSELLNSFEDEDISTLGLSPIKKEKSESYFLEVKSRREKASRERSAKRQEKRAEVTSKQKKNYQTIQNEREEKAAEILSKELEKSDSIQELKKKFHEEYYGKNMMHVASLNSKKIKSAKPYPGPQSYDTRKDLLDPRKGKTILGRREMIDNQKESPPFVYIPTDFDKIAKSQSNGSIGYFPRYYIEKTKKEIEEQNKKKDEIENFYNEKWEKYQKARFNSERYQNMEYFLEREKEKMEVHQDYMNELYKQQKLSQKRKEMEMKKQGIPIYNFLNYNLVEISSPSYSIQGRPFERLRGPKPPLTKEDLKTPNFNYIKRSPIGYTFGKEKRFVETEEKEESYLFPDGKFTIDDQVNFSSKEPFDSEGERMIFSGNNDNPGPGKYSIKGIAEEIEDKAKKVNFKKFESPNKKTTSLPTTNITN